MPSTLPTLFQPFRLRRLELANRIVVSPMCQYSADDGCANDWHLAHLGQLALSGAGLLFVEATAVEERGRITPGCTGLYSDDNERALARVLAHCRRYGDARLGIQLGHSGRKGSSARPWEGMRALTAAEGAWEAVAPSALPMDEASARPRALTVDEIRALPAIFAAATTRALRLGFDALELHAAHGYLLHSFWSPIANRREDEYGGSRDRRMRVILEVFAAMRDVWPADRPLGVRVSAVDWIDGGNTIEDTIVLARELQRLGCDWIDASSGGISPQQKIPVGPGYQVPFAAAIREATGMPTIAVGMITDPVEAEAIVASGKADLVALARAMLRNPRWAWEAAEALGASLRYPPQYERARPARRQEAGPAVRRSS